MGEPLPPRLLLVEDDPDAAALMADSLRDHFGGDCVRWSRTLAQGLAVDLDEIDLVLSDMNLPDGTGLKLMERLLEQREDLPVVLVTGDGILETAITAIQRGAYDYVVKTGDYQFAIPLVVEKNLQLWRVKQQNVKLNAQIERTLEQVKVKNQQLEEAVDKLETIAATDPLTGLANRRAFARSMDRRFAEATRHGHDLACIMIDLDGFKQLNDTLGHQRGDVLLQRAARVLEANCRRSDIAGRFGGDEFILVLPQTDDQAAAQVGHRVREEFARMAVAELGDEDTALTLTMSMGLATLSLCRAATPEQLIACADHALYCAKYAAKSGLMLYDPGRSVGRENPSLRD